MSWAGRKRSRLKVDSKTVGLIVAFQFQLYRDRECGHYSLIHKITQTPCSHRPWTRPNAQPRPRAIFPRQSEDRSELCLWQAAPAANRHTLINIWTATCNWKTASLKNDIQLSTCCCENCLDLHQNKSFLSSTVRLTTGSASYVRPSYPTLTQSSENKVNSTFPC